MQGSWRWVVALFIGFDVLMWEDVSSVPSIIHRLVTRRSVIGRSDSCRVGEIMYKSHV